MKTYDLISIGNAIVDMVAPIQDEELLELGVEKGIMQLVDDSDAARIYSKMRNPKKVAGGSAANTAVVAAQMGANVSYISKVAADELGIFFKQDLEHWGCEYDVAFSEEGQTGRSMILVSPDGERSMNTYLGASNSLQFSDISEEKLHNTKYVYLEGYRYDGPASQDAFSKVVNIVKSAGGVTSITLSDPFCVERHRSAFRDLITQGIDIVFCNELELQSYFEVNSREEALALAQKENSIFAMTAGADGAYIVEKEITHISTASVAIVDATGAGDFFAGGYLTALIKGYSHKDAAVIGCRVASEVIQVIGARVEKDLESLLVI